MLNLQMLNESRDYLSKYIQNVPRTAIVLGSGLSSLSDHMKNALYIRYRDIPHFFETKNPSHRGELISGELFSVPAIVLSGRVHCYEGYSMSEVSYYIGVLKLLGVENIILTNAAGGISDDLNPGDLMLVRDHINFSYESPLIPDNPFGERFIDTSNAYSKKLNKIALKAAKENMIDVKQGVYFYLKGPQYETPAEIRAIKKLGGDAVGMSTVPEALMAAACRLELMAISCITNKAAGLTDGPIHDSEVIEAGNRISDTLCALIVNIMKEVNKNEV